MRHSGYLRFTTRATMAWLVFLGAIGIIVLLLTLSRAAQANVYEDAAATAVLLVGPHGGRATGVVVGDRLILTAGHVAENGTMMVKIYDGRTMVSGRIVDIQDMDDGSPRLDYALVELPSDGLHAMPIRCDALEIGEPVFHVGSPWGLGQLVILWGRMSVQSVASPTSGRGRGLVGLEMSAGEGSSGGPVFDMAGRLVGIVVAVSPSYAFAVMMPVSLIGQGEHSLCPQPSNAAYISEIKQ